MQKVLVQRCLKCGKVFHDEANLGTIAEWGLCVRDNMDNERRDHVMGEILADQIAEAQAEMEA
jgi:hypothetical protein